MGEYISLKEGCEYMNDISPYFRWNPYDAAVGRKLAELDKTPEAIKYFAEKADGLSDYAYWFFLSTCWVSYSGFSDLELWKKLFSSNRSGKKKSIMKPSEVKVFEQLPWFVTIYRAHRPGESDWIAYTLNKDTAFRFARERGVNTIKEYQVKKKDITALFLRRGEDEVIVIDRSKVSFIREHIEVKEKVSLSPWKPGDKGYIALPLKMNVPDPQHEDWKLIQCPVCGDDCWESDLAREVLKSEGMKAACTMCTLRKGMSL